MQRCSIARRLESDWQLSLESAEPEAWVSATRSGGATVLRGVTVLRRCSDVAASREAGGRLLYWSWPPPVESELPLAANLDWRSSSTAGVEAEPSSNSCFHRLALPPHAPWQTARAAVCHQKLFWELFERSWQRREPAEAQCIHGHRRLRGRRTFCQPAQRLPGIASRTLCM